MGPTPLLTGPPHNSNAKVAGMNEDLDLDGDDYDWLLTIFYISYIIFEFQALMWKIVPPHIWAALMVFGWWVVPQCTKSCHSLNLLQGSRLHVPGRCAQLAGHDVSALLHGSL